MALSILNPFSYQEFRLEMSQIISSMVNYFGEKESGYWNHLFERYNFDGMDYHKGEGIRIKFNEKIRKAKDIEEIFIISKDILEWGKMQPLKSSMRNKLKQSLEFLDSLSKGENNNLDDLCVERLASITKIYEMWDLDNWIIYDSYCVKGLQWFISQIWAIMENRTHENYLKLPWPPARIGIPLNSFPRTAETAPKQKRLGFIYGSWLCKFIAEQLNILFPRDRRWRTFHVEMIAFQKGHEVT